MRIIILSMVLATILTGCYHCRKSVLFGNHNKNTNSQSYSVFMDERGSFYPEESIKNSRLKRSHGQLQLFYEKNNFEELKKAGNFETFESFQDHLVKKISSEINQRYETGKHESITIILLGYNNKYEPSVVKLNQLENKINEHLELIGKTSFIVPLYWDGKRSIVGADVLSIFNNANANSYNAGIKLRHLVNSLSANQINIISHSLGANVVTQLLFNQITKVQDDSSEGEESVFLNLKAAYSDEKYRTTNKTIKVGLIAPAIPGYSTFLDYDKRSHKYDPNYDNYKFFIGFNKYDPVLNKFIRRLSPTLSSTTFGCDYHNEIDRVKLLFCTKYNTENMEFIDFSLKKCNKHKKHGISSYMEMPQYDQLLKSIFNE